MPVAMIYPVVKGNLSLYLQITFQQLTETSPKPPTWFAVFPQQENNAHKEQMIKHNTDTHNKESWLYNNSVTYLLIRLAIDLSTALTADISLRTARPSRQLSLLAFIAMAAGITDLGSHIRTIVCKQPQLHSSNHSQFMKILSLKMSEISPVFATN